MRNVLMLWCVSLTLVFTSCESDTPTDNAIFTGLGQLQGTANVVDSLLQNIQADDSINQFFTATFADANRTLSFRNHLIDQFCELSGGPCRYNGKIMSEAHKNMQITDNQYNYMISDLQTALQQNNIPADIQSQFLNVLAPLKSQIVGK